MSIEEGKPYSCRNYDESDLVILSCHETASWSRLALSQLWSFLVWMFLHIICYFTSLWWNKGGIHAQRAWATHYIGTRTTEPIDVRLDALMRTFQLFFSTISVLVWVQKSYILGEYEIHYSIDVICSIFFLSHLLFALFRYGFSSVYVSGFEAFLDCFTITPLLLQHASHPMFGATWLNISYLRVYRMWTAFTRLSRAGILEPYLSDFNTVLITKIIECVCVIVTIAGTLWIIEGLGDIPGFFDTFIDAGMGKISFFQMCYFSFITISTVGYGDYSPTTIPGRLFILVATIGGVTFFSIISMEFVELQRLESSGGGKYRPSKERGHLGHILLVGGGIDSGAASVIKIFLQALCRDEDTPDIVLLGAAECTPDVRTVISDLNKKKFFVKYFQGTPMSVDDLKRVRADTVSFVFVVADFNTSTPLVEDESNILRTGALARFRPSLNYRLMLVEGKELELAMQVGLSPYGCYALSELKAAMLALNLRVPGMSTLVLNLCLPNIPLPDQYSEPISPWLEEFIQGGDLEIYGFPPHTKYYGKAFKEVVVDIAMNCNVIVIAAHVNGAIIVNPSNHIMNENSVLFAMSSDDDAVDVCARDGEADKGTWQDMLVENRERARKTKKLAGFTVKEEGNTSWLMKAISAAGASDRSRSSFNGSSSRSFRQSFDESKHSSSKNMQSEDLEVRTHSEGGFVFDDETTYNAIYKLNRESGGDDEGGVSDDGGGGMGTPSVDGSVHGSIKEDEEVKFAGFDLSLSSLGSGGAIRAGKMPSPTTTNFMMGGDGKRGLGPLPSMGSLTKRSVHPAAQRRRSQDWHPDNVSPHTPLSRRARSISKDHEDNLQYVVDQGGHTILCVLGTGDDAVQAWKIVEMIVGITRRTHDAPIIVVAQPSAKLSSLSSTFLLQPNGATLFVLEGDPKRMTTLLEAGVETCEQIVTLAPTAPPNSSDKSADMGLDGTMMDRENLLACSVLEHHLERWNRTDLAPVYDWFHPDAIKFMSPPPAPKHVLMQSSVANTFKTKSPKLSPIKQLRKPHGATRAARHTFLEGPTRALPSIPSLSSFKSTSFHRKTLSFEHDRKKLRRRSSTSAFQPQQSHAPSGWNNLKNKFVQNTNSVVPVRDTSLEKDEIISHLVDGLPNLTVGDMEFARIENRCHYRFASGRVLPKPAIAALFSMAYYTPGILELIEAIVNPTKTDQESLTWVAPVPLEYAGRPYCELAKHFYSLGAIPIGLLRGSCGPLPFVVAKLPLMRTKVDASDAIYFIAGYEWAEYNLMNYFDQAVNGGKMPFANINPTQQSSKPTEVERPTTPKSPPPKAFTGEGINLIIDHEDGNIRRFSS